jgi:hypothetical protein
MSQFDVATVASPAQWKRVRRVTLPTDRALSGRRSTGCLRLPAGVRPEHLSSRFPRIANALAEVSDDPEESRTSLDKLLGDGRKGARAFRPRCTTS